MTATADALAWGLRAIAVACLIDLSVLVIAVFIVRRRRGIR